ncbi:MAG TPA: M20 family metallopeptidase [Bacillota bacterium]|nr:M20 family metallopeptidase [Bacillota bacterium]
MSDSADSGASMKQAQLAERKRAAEAAVQAQREDLIALSHRIHETPELGFQEHKASAWAAQYLQDHGFGVELGVGALPTAFRAEFRTGNGDGPTIAILAEYDALAGLGHACGHNVICTSALGAAVAAARALEGEPARILCIGTPAEETGGGKIILIENGVFEGVDAAMMVHPGTEHLMVRGALSCITMTVRFHGRSAHAAGAPERGINALDALVTMYNSVGLLRQHVKDDVRIHGIFTKAGDAPNVTPHLTEAVYYVRARSHLYVQEVLQKVIACAEAGATATGCTMEYKTDRMYRERRNNHLMAGLYQSNLEGFGEHATPPPEHGGVGSSDIGNVSLVCPTIHPYVAMAPAGTAGHSPEFREAARSEAGDRALLLAAKCMAQTVVDLVADPANLARAKAEFAAAQRAEAAN